jgi:hypothetical protein
VEDKRVVIGNIVDMEGRSVVGSEKPLVVASFTISNIPH